MPATKIMQLTCAQAIARDDALFGTVIAPPKVGLFINDIEPNRETQFANITPMQDGDGPMTKFGTGGDQTVILDAEDGKFKVRLEEPDGGWRWDLGEVVPFGGIVYGWYLQANGGALLYAKRFPTPIPVEDGLESIYIPDIVLPLMNGVFE